MTTPFRMRSGSPELGPSILSFRTLVGIELDSLTPSLSHTIFLSHTHLLTKQPAQHSSHPTAAAALLPGSTVDTYLFLAIRPRPTKQGSKSCNPRTPCTPQSKRPKALGSETAKHTASPAEEGVHRVVAAGGSVCCGLCMDTA
jgi:hypothetical protein